MSVQGQIIYGAVMGLHSTRLPTTNHIQVVLSGDCDIDDESLSDFDYLVDFFVRHGIGRCWWNEESDYYVEVHA